MSGLENLGHRSPPLYSLQDLQRVGPNPPNGLYTLNQLGCILLYLKKLTTDDGLCDECLCMSTGETPCPHGNFREDPRLAPILVWPEDQSLARFTRYAPSNDDLEYWVTFNKTPRCEPDTRPFSTGPLNFCVNHPKDSMSRGAMPSSQASELENRAMIQSAPAASGSTTVQIQIPSAAAASDALSPFCMPSASDALSPFCIPPLASFETRVTTLSPERSSPASTDTVDAIRTTRPQELWTEQSASTHCLTPHGLHLVGHGSHSLMQLATNSPGPESLGFRGAILRDDPCLLSGKPQSVVATSMTVSAFTNSSIGPASTGGGPSQHGEFMLGSEMFYEHAKNAFVGMQL